MGEYVTYNGCEIKLGTCEEMYYLRADQRHLIRGYDFSPDAYRYRFPFPDEDAIGPGRFEDYDRGVKIPDWKIPEDYEGHGTVQFKANYPDAGYLVSLPCPEQFPRAANGMGADLPNGVHVGFNGYNAQPRIVQQLALEGILYTVVSCGGCGNKWRLGPDAATDVVAAFRADADRREWRRLSSGWDEERGCWGDSCTYGFEPAHTSSYSSFLRGIADRIEAGYLGLDAGEAGLVPVGSAE